MRKREKIYSHLSYIFDTQKINDKILRDIFYLSLFETSHFEQSGFYYNIEKIRKNIENILKTAGSEWAKDRNIAENIINGQFFTGKVTNLVFEYVLSKHYKTGFKTTFIDGHEIDCYCGEKKLSIEIKRLFSTGNIWDYVEEEIKKYKAIKNTQINKILVVFIIIFDKEEQKAALSRFIDGYRNLFDVLKNENKIPQDFEFFITYFSPESSIGNFIKDLTDRISSVCGD